MSTINPSASKDQNGFSGGPEKSNGAASIINRPVTLGILAFLIFSGFFSVLIYQRYELVKDAEIKLAKEIVNQAKDKIQEAITHSLAATKTLAFFIGRDGTVTDFDSIAKQILESGNDIDALQLVPGGVIKYVYPLKGNEKVIGYNILADSARNKEAYKAIEKREMFFAGPFQLRQGGVGVVGRLPVYRNNKFWGFSAVVIKMSTLFKTAGIDSSGENGYYFQLSKINPDTRQEENFLPLWQSQSKSQVVSVKVPDGEWKLSVMSAKRNPGMVDIIILAGLGLLLSILFGIYVYRIAIRPKRLNELVKERTRELKNSESNYRSLIERVSDAFVSLDKDWRYTYVNKKAGEILNKDPGYLLGKNIWEEFPKGVGSPFHQAYYRAMETQKYQYLEEYYVPFEKWLENHIYPSADGLTIFFKDVTEIKQVSLALKNKEEKYRSLIEQASDGIVITDLEGKILEVNNSIMEMVGCKESEMTGHHLIEFLPEEDMDTNPLRINELMKGKSLLYERRILKKDGTKLDVEVNSKMASSHTLIGFVRDISERKKVEAVLQYQSRLIEGVSDAITSLDMERRIVSWNRACEELYGLTTEAVIGKRIPELMSFDFPDTTTEEVFKQVYTQGYWKGEFNFIHPVTRLEVNLLSSLNLLRDSKNNITGFIIISKDITERKTVEEALKKSNERFELIAQATNDVIWDHDFVNNITWGNKNLYRLYGIEYGSGIINFEMFISRIHPEDREGIRERMASAITRKETTIMEEFRFRTADGDYRTFYDRAYIKYDESGKALQISGAMMDITEREKAKRAIEKSEEKYRLIVEQASDGIFTADSNTYFIDVNTAGCQMLGYTEEEIKKIRIIDLIPEEDKVTNPVQIMKLKEGESVINERRLKRKDGSLIDVEISAKLLPDGRYQSIARDITERKKAEDKLVEKEKKLQQVLASTADNFYVIDTDYNVVIINKVAERNLEIAWGKPVTLDTNLLDVIPAKGEEPIRENFEKAFAGEVIEYEMHLSHPDLPTWVLIQFTPVIDESGGITGVSVVAKDISERKKTEELIRESEERYRALVENAPEALVVFDVKKQMFVNVSESATRLFGMTKEELLKIGPVDVSPEYQPDGRLSAEAAQVYMQQAINGEKPSFEWTHCNKTGGLISCEVWLVRLPAEKEVLIRGSIMDITERKKAAAEVLKSKKQFQSLVENISGVYWVNNLETYQTLYISPSYETVWGLKCEDLYNNPADFINSVHPEDKAFLEEAHKNIADTRKANLSYRIIKPDGQVRWISANINVIHDPNGNKIEYGYAEDITERKKSEEELQYSEQKYRLLFYNNPLPMWMTTLPGLDIIDVNEAAIRQYGYSREEFLKLNTRSLRPEEDLEEFLKEADKMLPDVINIRAWRHKKKDGTIIHVETYSHQIMYEGRRVWLGLSHDVTEEYKAKELLQKSYDEIRQLASNLQSIREDERTNIAREIHDELGQQLTGLKMDMHWLTRKLKDADEDINKKMQNCIELINSTITTVRKIATDLRPSILDDLGLLAALEWQSEEFENRSGTKVIFDNHVGDISVAPLAATALFRIYQELLTNIARHANATVVKASLRSDENSLYFSTKDNGTGFNLNTIHRKKTLGLLGIKERTLLIGGNYEIKSNPGEGAEIIISIPLTLVKNDT